MLRLGTWWEKGGGFERGEASETDDEDEDGKVQSTCWRIEG
jgi:hypothetical protein